jgi:uncharacterized protein
LRAKEGVMTQTNGAERLLTLDAMRGLAVMGILLMNIVMFAMPSQAYINPLAWGGDSALDLGIWFFNLVLVDGKMRGLFTLLFGASTLLVIERAEAKGKNSIGVHYRRMAWLLLFGVAHYYLIWSGDILILYAACGLVIYAFHDAEPSKLKAGAILSILINFIVWAMIALSFIHMEAVATRPGAAAHLVQSYQEAIVALGVPGSWAISQELQVYTGGYADILAYRTEPSHLFGPLTMMMMYGFETVGLMMLGMALYRNGFLTGHWRSDRYASMARRCYLVGLPPMLALGWWCWSSGFDAVTTFNAVLVWSTPFRIVLTLGHAAFALWLFDRYRNSAAVARIAAAGRAAFTNYLGTSIVMTTIFYGYGLGLFGQVSRAGVYAFVIGSWALMLLWSKPWLDRFAYGPFEWAWRSLARGRAQAIRSR